ncbi:hypothetical protein GCM10015535_17260 [Streptomyces gelaticus]|uniref:Uncharacterized protein n=1 Tax=Streptomyces gelaticus TaxID=285446 RepID=A0ABQ2VUH7_9ACTN|nr:hypothetical protein GCM10015535_17260 [Streptomyces gelaticus]
MSYMSHISRMNRMNHYEGVETCSLLPAPSPETLSPTHLASIRFQPLVPGHPVTAVVIAAPAGAQ